MGEHAGHRQREPAASRRRPSRVPAVDDQPTSADERGAFRPRG